MPNVMMGSMLVIGLNYNMAVVAMAVMQNILYHHSVTPTY